MFFDFDYRRGRLPSISIVVGADTLLLGCSRGHSSTLIAVGPTFFGFDCSKGRRPSTLVVVWPTSFDFYCSRANILQLWLL